MIFLYLRISSYLTHCIFNTWLNVDCVRGDSEAECFPCLFSVPPHSFIHSLHSAFWFIFAFSIASLHRPIFNAQRAGCLNANGQRGWHELSTLQMPKLVTHPSSQAFLPIYLSLLPMTGHEEMDTEALLHIDSGSCNSQARRGLSSASSFHFLYVRGRETGPRRSYRHRSLYSVLSKSHYVDAEYLVTLNVSSGSKGKGFERKRSSKARFGSKKVDMWTFQDFAIGEHLGDV